MAVTPSGLRGGHRPQVVCGAGPVRFRGVCGIGGRIPRAGGRFRTGAEVEASARRMKVGSGAKFTPRMASAGRLALRGASWSVSPRGCPDPQTLGSSVVVRGASSGDGVGHGPPVPVACSSQATGPARVIFESQPWHSFATGLGQDSPGRHDFHIWKQFVVSRA